MHFVAVRSLFSWLVVTREPRNARICSHWRSAVWFGGRGGGRVGGGHFLSSELGGL